MDHFFERLERENNYQLEYEKLEKLCTKEYFASAICGCLSINSWIEKNFWHWKRRSNYISFSELRDHLGFSLSKPPSNIDMSGYFLFSEMILNLINDMKNDKETCLDEVIDVLYETMRATIDKTGFEIRNSAQGIVVLEKNPVAIDVADNFPDISEVIIEYNHYLLKGNIDRKRSILQKIAMALEPQKDELNSCNSRMTKDFFYLVNNMNVRHNNSDPNSKAYTLNFDLLSIEEKEAWYDLIYEQSLALFVLLKQRERNKKIDEYKKQR